MPPFQLVSEFQPTGDQPKAISGLIEGLDKGFIGGPGAFGFGGPHGLKDGSRPNQTPAAQPTQSSDS